MSRQPNSNPPRRGDCTHTVDWTSENGRARAATRGESVRLSLSAEPLQCPLLSLLPPPPGTPLALSQLPDGLEAQLRASATAYVGVPAGEQACSVLRNRASIPCELFSGRIVQAMLASTQALADRAAANLAQLRAIAAAMSPAELAVPAWMARFQEQPRLLDEHLVAAYMGVAASGTSLRTALEAGTVCDQAYLMFFQQSYGDLARFLCRGRTRWR